jgi:hypothetical protein
MRWMNSKDGVFAYGVSWGYLVVRGETEVILSRFSVDLVASNLTAAVAAEAVRNVIVFPLGRGPGRPGGDPELDALVTSARVYAERFESGESLEGYPAWQHAPVAARRHYHGPGPDDDRACRDLHELDGPDRLADLRVEDGHVPDYNRAEAEWRLGTRLTGSADGCPSC